MLDRLCGPERRRVTLDDRALRDLAQRDPVLFFERFPPPVMIDEVQYAPQLLSEIKLHVDRSGVAGGFWLTGSQQFRAMKGITETLAGRVAIVNMLGFSEREKRRMPLHIEPFLPTPDILARRVPNAGSPVPPSDLRSTYAAIFDGSFPALCAGRVHDRDLFFRSYVQTYLERDVRDLATVGDLDAFGRFLRACAARTAQLVNYSDLARDAGVSVNTARSWLSILVASFQVILLTPWSGNVTNRLVKAPKLHFLDTGLCAHLTAWSSPETLEAGAMSGAILESHVVSEILKSWWHRLREPRIYYYRDRDGREVDLVLEADGTLYPVEVKRAGNVDPRTVAPFGALERSGGHTGTGAVVCLCRELLPLDRTNAVVPVGLI